MDTKIITVIIAWCATIVIFAVEVVLQVLDVQSTPIAIVVGIIGGIAFIVAVIMTCVLIKTRKKEKLQRKTTSIHQLAASQAEINERIESRKQYLPELKNILNDYIARVEYLANSNDDILLNPESYDSVYFTESMKPTGVVKKTVSHITAVLHLYDKKLHRNNLKLREIEDTDVVLNEIRTKMEGLNTFVKDRIVRTNVKGYPEAVHVVCSYEVFNRLIRKYFAEKPFVHQIHFKLSEKAITHLRDLQNNTNRRIDELLEGAEDEL